MAPNIPSPIRLLVGVSLLTVVRLTAQQAEVSSQLPQFEVASIKPIDPDPNVMRSPGVTIFPGGRVVISASELKSLICIAFHLSYWQISGGDAWTGKEKYDLEAKPPEKAQSSIRNLRYTWFGIEDEQLREMLQALLIDRFQLRFHRETKTGKVYRLERSGKPLRLLPEKAPSGEQASDRHSGQIGFVGGRWYLSNTSLLELAQYAADYVLHAPVADRTELSGWFHYTQPIALAESEPNYANPSDSFVRLIPELGLKLVSGVGSVETFVIDHAETPSAN